MPISTAGGTPAVHGEFTRAPWGVVFDVDGTMVDNHAWHQAGWIELGRRRGLPIDADYYRDHIHSKDNGVILENMRKNFGLPELGQDVADEKEAIYRELYRPVLKPMDGLMDFLEQLRLQRIPCAVASNAPEPNARMILEALAIEDLFAAVITPGPTLPGKPEPDIFLAAAAALNLAPSRCVVFEDSYSGFLAAGAAGMPCVAILHGASTVSLPYAARTQAQHRDFTTVHLPELLEALGL